MQTIAERIRKLRKDFGLTQRDLGGKVGVTSVTVSKWELDTATPKANSIIIMCDVFGVELQWLMWGKGDGISFGPSKLAQNEGVTKVPFFHEIESLVCNGESVLFANADDDFYVPSGLFSQKLEQTVCFKVSGDSMEPHFKIGSLLFVDLKDKKINDGTCYLINHDGLIRLKCLEKIPNGVVLKSYNPMYKDATVTDMNNFCILGKVFSQLSFYG